jgi:hypothetical protein
MKRLVNLFRFYAFIVNRRGIMSEARSQGDVFRQVARVAALANRWPHLLDLFAMPASASVHERRVVLEDLEDTVDDEARWCESVQKWHLAGAERSGDMQSLREFLRGQPHFAALARDLL